MNKIDRKPPWLKVKAFGGEQFKEVNKLLKQHELNTVCQEANCPNRSECFSRGTATFLILGPTCTRNCTFCNIESGAMKEVDSDEPRRVAELAKVLNLKHVVITSVTRDDLVDGGANQFYSITKQIREKLPNTTIELLTPDFKDQEGAVETVITAEPDIFNHNLETVKRLYPQVRPQADYDYSMSLLDYVQKNSNIITKSGIMVGIGESVDELKELFDDLNNVNVSILTIGQYLAPSPKHLKISKYYHPNEFEQLKELAQNAGIKKVLAAPLVRSSYKAEML
jgi:lipoic acid synthetase